jgi:hypothetical protein
MRRATKTEQEKLEIDAAERTDRRKIGFDLMKVRDSGGYVLSNGVKMNWSVPVPEIDGLADDEIFVFPRNIPDGYFSLTFGGKELFFEKEEFMRYLRWV